MSTFYNNLAAGAVLAGVLVPLISYMAQDTEFDRVLRGEAPWTPELRRQIVQVAAGILVAFGVALILRGHADRLVSKLQD